MRHAARAACLVLLLVTSALAQQQPAAAPAAPQFLSRYDFHLSAAPLFVDDERFSWDTHFGGEVDVVDYVVGRLSTAMDYEAVLGSQLRAFDPNQGNYTLEASASGRLGGLELAGMLHHVSRHLSDRAKTFAIAWNVLGVRALKEVSAGDTTVDAVADIGWVTQRATVDYKWAANLDVGVRHPTTPRTAVYVRGVGHLLGTTPTPGILPRDTQTGGSIEGGVRVGSTAAVAELYVGFERRMDADPLDFQPRHWAFVGFRLVRR